MERSVCLPWFQKTSLLTVPRLAVDPMVLESLQWLWGCTQSFCSLPEPGKKELLPNRAPGHSGRASLNVFYQMPSLLHFQSFDETGQNGFISETISMVSFLSFQNGFHFRISFHFIIFFGCPSAARDLWGWNFMCFLRLNFLSTTLLWSALSAVICCLGLSGKW